MPEFTVSWVIQVDAESPEEAARKAKAVQSAPDTIADVYNVAHSDGTPIGALDEDSLDVDLSALDGRLVD